MTPSRWEPFRDRTSEALLLLVILWPAGMIFYAYMSYLLTPDALHIWVGDASTHKLPRMRTVSADKIAFLRYAWFSICAEDAVTRWWTSTIAVLAGFLALAADLVPRPKREQLGARLGWLALGAGSLLIGLDERFQLHEWGRNHVVKPTGLTDGTDLIGAGDIVTLIYPIGGLAVWWVLYRSSIGDSLRRGILWALIPMGLLAVGIDVLNLDLLNHYPGWAYGGIVEESMEWAVAGCLAVLAWRRLSGQVILAATPDGASRDSP